MTGRRGAPSGQGPGPPPRPLVAAGAVGLAVLVALAVLVGCRDRDPVATTVSATPAMPTATDPASGLLVLAGRVGAMELIRGGPDGRPVHLPLPESDVVWVSAGPGGILLVTTVDGRAFLGGSTGTEGPMGWRTLRPVTPIGATPIRLSFGTLAPDGTVAAFVAPGASSSGASVVTLGIASGGTTTIPLGGEPAGWPLAWIGARLVVLRRVAGDRVAAAIVDPGGLVPLAAPYLPGFWTDGIMDDVAGLAASADGRVAAILGRDYGSVTIVRLDPPGGPGGSSAPGGLAGSVVDIQLEPLADGSKVADWIALSPAGDRLAVVRADALGNAAAIEIRAATSGWTRVAGWDLPTGEDRAVVAWAP